MGCRKYFIPIHAWLSFSPILKPTIASSSAKPKGLQSHRLLPKSGSRIVDPGARVFGCGIMAAPATDGSLWVAAKMLWLGLLARYQEGSRTET
jgi:hypothetical protein